MFIEPQGAADVGRIRVILNVRDGHGGEDDQTFFIEVSSPANQAVKAAAEWVAAPSGRELFLEVSDMQADNDPSRPDVLDVTLRDEYGAELGRLSLRETSARSGVFRGLFSEPDIPYAVHTLMDFQASQDRSSMLTLQWKNRNFRLTVTR